MNFLEGISITMTITIVPQMNLFSVKTGLIAPLASHMNEDVIVIGGLDTAYTYIIILFLSCLQLESKESSFVDSEEEE